MFNDKFTRHQDYDLNIRASFYKFSFIYIDQPLSTYATSRKSHKIKGEGVKYSYFWLNEMKPYLTKKIYFHTKHSDCLSVIWMIITNLVLYMFL